eukprot:7500295-Prorocentrum_lima.AAC.1
MTSSLVGSEMCIRDRVWHEHEGRRGRLMWLGIVLLWAPWHLPTERLVAVSYTHLTLPTICSV